MTRPADKLVPPSSTEPQGRPEPGPGQRAEQLAERVNKDARAHAPTYLRETIVREGGE